MNRKARAAFRMVWAAVLGAIPAVCTAAEIVVPPGGDLAGAIQNAASGDTIRLEAGVHTLSAPVTLDGDKQIQLEGDVITRGPLPTDFVVRFGSGTGSGNAVRNGDFELGRSDWTVTGAASEDVITQDGHPAGGTWHAWLKPTSGPLMPDDQQELRLTPINYTDIPATLQQKVNLSVPAPGSPAQLLYELRQPLNLPAVPPVNVQRITLSNVPITLMTPNLHLWVQARQFNTGDRIEVFLDDETGAPVGVIDDSSLSIGIGDVRIYGFNLSPYTGVHNIIIRATTAAGAAVGDPSLYFLAAAEMRSDLLPPQPLIPPLAPLDPQTLIIAQDPTVAAWFASAGITPPPPTFTVSLGIPGVTNIIPLGGFGTPRLSMKVSVPQKNPNMMSADTLDIRVYDALDSLMSLRILPADDPLFATPTSCIPVQVTFPSVPVKDFSLACRIARPSGPTVPVDTQFVVDDLQLTPLHPALLTFFAVNLLKNPSFEFGPADWVLTTPEFGEPPVTVEDLLTTDPADQCNGAKSLRFRFPTSFTPKLFAWIKIPQWNSGRGDYFQIQADGSPRLLINDTSYATYATGDWVKIAVPLSGSDPINLTFEAQTNTRATDPSIILVGAAEVGTVELGPAPVNLLSLAIGTEEPVPGLNVPLPSVKRTSSALAYRGTEALLFGGIGFPHARFKISAPKRSGNGTDKIALVINNSAIWSAEESDVVFSASCASVELPPFDPGSTIDARFIANLADTGNPTNNTIFVVDDFCLTPVCSALESLDPTLDGCAWSLTPSMDDTSGWLSWGPAGPLNTPIIRVTAYACSPDKAAVFTALGAEARKATITLSQGLISIPTVSPYLSFHLTASGDVTDKLICSINGQSLIPVFAASDTTLAAGRDVSLVIPNALWGQNNATLEFKALVSPAVSSDVGFRIDNVSITPTASGLIFILEGNAQLRVTGVTFENGNPAFSLRDQSRLCMTRCLVRAYSGQGIILNNESKADLVCSVVDGSGEIRNDGIGRLMLFQCTILGTAPTGTGPIDAVASILWDGISESNSRVILSYVPGSAYPTPEPDFPNLDLPHISFDSAGWPGKLADSTENLGLRNIKKVGELPSWALPECGSSGQDFEGDFRSGSDGLMAGADEIGGGTGGDLPRWVSCTVSPNPAGKNSAVTITIETLNINLNGGAVILVPEEPVAGVQGMVDNPAHIVVLPLSNVTDPNRARISISFTSPFTYRSALNTPVCTDGLNQIYLRDSGGNLYGPGRNEDAIEPQVRTNWRFLVDTLPPELVVLPGNGNAQAGSPRISGSTDNVLAAEGPGGWPPQVLPMPASYGIIDIVGSQATPDTTAKDRHVFLNAPPGQPLEVTVEARFTDPRPQNTLGQQFNLLTVSGFGNTSIDVANVPINSYAEYATGSARARLSTDSTGLASSYRTTPGSVTGESVTVIWNCVFDESEGLKLVAQPQVKDLAGNESKKPAYALKVWWLQNARAAFTVGPQGVSIRKPRFEWRMDRPFNFAADEIFPCYPIARYKLWAAVDAGVAATQTRWRALSGWSPWIRGPIELDTSELNLLQLDPELQGRMILITITGGDEAGNIQPAGLADGATLTSVADLEGSGVAYRWWINGESRTQTSIDTNASISLFWHDGNNVIRQFGAARRVPAPPADKGLLVDAKVELMAIMPTRAVNIDSTAALSQVVIHWTLFRDGQPIKPDTELFTDTVSVSRDGKVTFRLSEVLRSLAQSTGLTLADPAVLFNPGKRERRFALTAVAEAFIPDTTGGTISIKDSTPVTIEFAIYPAEKYEGVRDERPARVYQRQ